MLQFLFGWFLFKNTKNNYQEFRLVVNKITGSGRIEFYIHPVGKDGTTFDGVISSDSSIVHEKISYEKLKAATLKNDAVKGGE